MEDGQNGQVGQLAVPIVHTTREGHAQIQHQQMEDIFAGEKT